MVGGKVKTCLEARSSREETSIRIYKDEKKVNDFENCEIWRTSYLLIFFSAFSRFTFRVWNQENLWIMRPKKNLQNIYLPHKPGHSSYRAPHSLRRGRRHFLVMEDTLMTKHLAKTALGDGGRWQFFPTISASAKITRTKVMANNLRGRIFVRQFDEKNVIWVPCRLIWGLI